MPKFYWEEKRKRSVDIEAETKEAALDVFYEGDLPKACTDSIEVIYVECDGETVAVEEGAELAPRMSTHADVGLFSVLCYYSFDGEPNCGHVLWQTDRWIVTTAETRLVRNGDSGSPLLTRDGELVGVVVEGDGSPGLMRAAKVPREWMAAMDL